jgi:hypothetical protein
MSINGFAGFPLLDGVPRGYSFVDFMRNTPGGTAPSSSAPAPAPARLTPGGFDDNASHRVISESRKDLGNDRTRIDKQQRFTDGSIRTSSRTVFPDGTQEASSERRSLVDADGFQKVRVLDTTFDADGTRHVEVRVFRVPEGMALDWDSAEAQQYFSHSDGKSIPKGMTWHDVPSNRPAEMEPDTSERPQDMDRAEAENARPVLPLAT